MQSSCARHPYSGKLRPVDSVLSNSAAVGLYDSTAPPKLPRRQDALDLAECKREIAQVRALRYKATLQRKLDRQLKPRELQVGDYVLKRKEASKTIGKLDSPWEGPYRIKKASLHGHSYVLEGAGEAELPRTWNIQDLRKFYY